MLSKCCLIGIMKKRSKHLTWAFHLAWGSCSFMNDTACLSQIGCRDVALFAFLCITMHAVSQLEVTSLGSVCQRILLILWFHKKRLATAGDNHESYTSKYAATRTAWWVNIHWERYCHICYRHPYWNDSWEWPLQHSIQGGFNNRLIVLIQYSRVQFRSSHGRQSCWSWKRPSIFNMCSIGLHQWHQTASPRLLQDVQGPDSAIKFQTINSRLQHIETLL